MIDPLKKNFNNKEAAEFVGIEPDTLQVWRCTKRVEIPYYQLGGKNGKVVYKRKDLEAWMESQRVEVSE